MPVCFNVNSHNMHIHFMPSHCPYKCQECQVGRRPLLSTEVPVAYNNAPEVQPVGLRSFCKQHVMAFLIVAILDKAADHQRYSGDKVSGGCPGPTRGGIR